MKRQTFLGGAAVIAAGGFVAKLIGALYRIPLTNILGGEGASRVHGGGLAGTIQAFVPKAKLSEFKSEMERVFGKGSCYVLMVRPAGGTEIEIDG